MAKIQDGSTVRFHYTLKVDGHVVDSSGENEPFEYVHGEKRIVPGLEQQLEGLEVGDKRSVTIPPEDGYGDPDPDLMHQVERAAFENSDQLNVGDFVNGETPQGQFQARVAAPTNRLCSSCAIGEKSPPASVSRLSFCVVLSTVAVSGSPGNSPSTSPRTMTASNRRARALCTLRICTAPGSTSEVP